MAGSAPWCATRAGRADLRPWKIFSLQIKERQGFSRHLSHLVTRGSAKVRRASWRYSCVRAFWCRRSPTGPSERWPTPNSCPTVARLANPVRRVERREYRRGAQRTRIQHAARARVRTLLRTRTEHTHRIRALNQQMAGQPTATSCGSSPPATRQDSVASPSRLHSLVCRTERGNGIRMRTTDYLVRAWYGVASQCFSAGRQLCRTGNKIRYCCNLLEEF